jgi:serine/threonine-protein kinase
VTSEVGQRPQCPTCGSLYAPTATYCPLDGSRLTGPPVQLDQLVGRDLDGRYIIRRMLGAGGMATVYAGVQLMIERDVAIKVIHPAVTDAPAVAGRLIEAGRIACQLSGPAVVNVFDFGQSDDGLVYLVMELVRGRTLAAELLQRTVPARRVVAIAIQICDALAVAHGRGVAHGCLWPSNVMLVDDSVRRDGVKVLDFGMVPPAGDPNSGLHARYHAPELEARVAEPRADLYALGCIMHEMLTGAPAFSDASKHKTGEHPKLPPNVPLPLAELIGQLLATKPSDRPESASAVRRLLEPMQLDTPASPTSPPPMGDRVVGRHEPTAVTSSPFQAPAWPTPIPMPQRPTLQPMPAPPPPSPSGGKRVLVIAAVAIVTTGLGLLGYYLATS